MTNVTTKPDQSAKPKIKAVQVFNTGSSAQHKEQLPDLIIVPTHDAKGSNALKAVARKKITGVTAYG